MAVRRHDEEKATSFSFRNLGVKISPNLEVATGLNSRPEPGPRPGPFLRCFLDEIRSAEWYSLIVDETREASGAKQLGYPRWVDSSYTVHENLIGLEQVDATDAATLAYIIKDTLLRLNLQLTQFRGQAYDDAANMADRLNGVAIRLQTEQNSILLILPEFMPARLCT